MEYLHIPNTIFTLGFSPAAVRFITPELSFQTSDVPTIEAVINGALDSYVDTQHDVGVSVSKYGDIIRVILLGEDRCTFVDVPQAVFQRVWANVPVC